MKHYVGNPLQLRGAEQYVLQELKNYDDIPVTYWGTDTGTAEVDFVIQKTNQVIPIEVKASTNLKAKSLATYR